MLCKKCKLPELKNGVCVSCGQNSVEQITSYKPEKLEKLESEKENKNGDFYLSKMMHHLYDLIDETKDVERVSLLEDALNFCWAYNSENLPSTLKIIEKINKRLKSLGFKECLNIK